MVPRRHLLTPPRVATLLLAMALVARPAAAQEPGAAPPLAWEVSPYKITVLLLVDPAAGLRAAQQEALSAGIVDRCDALIGARWNVALAPCPGALAALYGPELAEIDAEQFPPELLKQDKVVVLRVAAGAGGFDLRAREFCQRTRSWSPVFERKAVRANQLADEAFALLLSSVRTLVSVYSADDKNAELRPMGCKLLTREPAILDVPVGTILRPLYRSNDFSGNLKTLQLVDWTFLLATETTGESIQAMISTGLRSPLNRRVGGRFEKLAIVVPNVGGGTRLELVARGERKDPLSGYEVYAHPADSPKTEFLGRTGPDGTLWVPAGASPLRVLLVKSGGDFLARLPIVPGLTPTSRAEVADDRERLRAEGVIVSLQESLVDLVARRAVVVARIKSAVDAGEIEKAQQLVERLRAVRSQQDQFANSLRQQRQLITSQDPVTQRKIEQLFTDTEKLMAKFFDPRPLDEVESSVHQAAREAGAAPPAEPPAGS